MWIICQCLIFFQTFAGFLLELDFFLISGFKILIFPCIFCLKGLCKAAKAGLSGMKKLGQYEAFCQADLFSMKNKKKIIRMSSVRNIAWRLELEISPAFKYLLPYLPYVFGQTGLSKQYRPRWDAAKRGVSSGSTLFATHPAVFRHNIG